jgi:hypothetical protein
MHAYVVKMPFWAFRWAHSLETYVGRSRGELRRGWKCCGSGGAGTNIAVQGIHITVRVIKSETLRKFEGPTDFTTNFK